MSSVSPARLVALSLVTALFVPLMIHGPVSAGDSSSLDGGSISVAVVGPVSVDPASTGPSNQTLHELIYDALARKSPDTLLPQPWLASSWDIDENLETITFHVRPEAKWEDGRTLDANDVVLNFGGYAVSNSSGNVVFNFGLGGGGRFLDEGIYRPIVYRAGDLNKHYSGPFMPNETASDHLTIAYNSNHWNVRPHLDSIRYNFYSNISLAACALITEKDTFIGVPLTGEDLTTTFYPCGRIILDLNNTKLFFSTEVPGLSVTYLGMNTNATPLDDSVLRGAITRTLDRELFITAGGRLSYTNIADSFISPFNTFWFNASVPKYRVPDAIVDNRVTPIFDTINMDLESAGYMDWNYDGWREMPSKQPFTISVLRLAGETPAFIDTLETNLRAVGIRVVDNPVATTADIMSRVAVDNFALYVGTLQTNQTPSFLRSYFASSEIARGRNYFNYFEPTLDLMLTNLDDSLNMTMRQKYARDAQTLIATQAPAATIVTTRALSAYNKTTYQGWVNMLGGINNFWSFYELHAIPTGSMKAEVSLLVQGNRLDAGKSADVKVAVTNDTGPIKGATVTITVSSGSIAVATGVTDVLGAYTTRYTAANVTVVTDVFINANVTMVGHPDTVGQLAIAVHPMPGEMSVTVVFPPNKRNIASGEEIEITVTVISMVTSLPLPGATVSVAVIPEGIGAELTPASGTTDASGTFKFKFKATVDISTNFALPITVTSPGYADAHPIPPGVVVSERGGAPSTPGPDVIILVAVVTLLAFIYGVRRSKRWEDPSRKK